MSYHHTITLIYKHAAATTRAQLSKLSMKQQ